MRSIHETTGGGSEHQRHIRGTDIGRNPHDRGQTKTRLRAGLKWLVAGGRRGGWLGQGAAGCHVKAKGARICAGECRHVRVEPADKPILRDELHTLRSATAHTVQATAARPEPLCHMW